MKWIEELDHKKRQMNFLYSFHKYNSVNSRFYQKKKGLALQITMQNAK